MSIQAMSWVFDQSKSRGHARLVLLSLANHANHATAECFPSVRTIAAEAGISKSEAHRVMTELEGLGELEIVDRGGPRRSARYRLTFIKCVPQGDIDEESWDAVSHPGGDAASRADGDRTVIDRHLTGSGDASVAPPRRGTTIPLPFIVSDDMWAWAERECPSVNADHETKTFVAYWRGESGAKAAKRDWEQAWRTWLLKEQRSEARRKSYGPAQRAASR